MKQISKFVSYFLIRVIIGDREGLGVREAPFRKGKSSQGDVGMFFFSLSKRPENFF